jgi:hypothetical protein
MVDTKDHQKVALTVDLKVVQSVSEKVVQKVVPTVVLKGPQWVQQMVDLRVLRKESQTVPPMG